MEGPFQITALEYSEGGHPNVQAHDGLGDIYQSSLNELKSITACRVLFSHDARELTQGAGGPAPTDQ